MVSIPSALGARLRVLGYCTARSRLTKLASHSPVHMVTDYWWAWGFDKTLSGQRLILFVVAKKTPNKDTLIGLYCVHPCLSPPSLTNKSGQWSSLLQVQGSGRIGIPLIWGHNISVHWHSQDVHFSQHGIRLVQHNRFYCVLCVCMYMLVCSLSLCTALWGYPMIDTRLSFPAHREIGTRLARANMHNYDPN